MRIFFIRHYKLSCTVKNLIKWIFTFEWINRPSINDIINNQSFQTWLSESNEYNLRKRAKRKIELN